MKPSSKYVLFAALMIFNVVVSIWSIVTILDKYPKEIETYEEIPFQKGMSFTTWGSYSYNSTEVFSELDSMKENNIEWVATNVWWLQDNLTATEIESGPWSDTDANLTEYFEYAHSIGLKILFKPMLDTKTDQWRSYINASDEWFEEYSDFIVHLADVANDSGVEIFSIGCEMGTMQVREDKVREMVAEIRLVYDGLLTYAANHDSFWYVTWWDIMDIISLDSWFPFTMEYDPEVEQLTKVWNGFYDRFDLFAKKLNKPILFAEFGAQARDGANMVPNDNKFNLNQDVYELQDIYRSLFNSKIWTAPWFKGVYWWMWDCIEVNITDNIGFTPKFPSIIELVSREYYQTRQINMFNPRYVYLILTSVSIISVVLILGLSLKSSLTKESVKDDEDNLENERECVQDRTRSRARPYLSGMIIGVWVVWMFSYYLQHTFAVLYSAFTYSQFLLQSNLLILLEIAGMCLASLIVVYFIIKQFLKIRKEETENARRILVKKILSFLLILVAIISNLFFVSSLVSTIETFYLDTVAAFLNCALLTSIVAVIIIHYIPKSIFELTKVGITVALVGSIGMFSLLYSDFLLTFVVSIFMISSAAILMKPEPKLHELEKNRNIETTQNISQPNSDKRTDFIALFKVVIKDKRFLLFILTGFGFFLGLSGFISTYNLINFNLNLIFDYFGFLLLSLAIQMSIWLIIQINKINKNVEKSQETQKTDIISIKYLRYSMLLFFGTIVFGMILPDYQNILGLLGGSAILGFWLISLLRFISMRTRGFKDLPKLWTYLFVIVLAITIGFLMNGIKASMIFVLTFFDIVDGKIVVRTDFTTSVNYDIPTVLNFVITLLSLILILIAFLIVTRYRKQIAISNRSEEKVEPH
ncbi:MAG: hypothetical protein GF364_04645 [Candidatus Lokiarchaeota archaeon]|nr:hypothetical protein [Candidatus Lokiarchaeota archaeon]